MIDVSYSLLLILIISGITILFRFLPFMVFPAGKETPKTVTYLGKVLPYAIMGMLVVYCIKGVSLFSYPHALPELIAMALVALLHVWKRNSLISISVGTVFYMILVQIVFKT